jgi:hypothetical protein
LGAQQAKLDADLRTSALLGTPSVPSVHDYYTFALTDGGRLVPMANELIDRHLAILVAVRRFPCMGGAGSRSLRFNNYVRMQHFACRSTYVPLRRLLGDIVRREVLQRLFAGHGTLGSYLRDALQEGIADIVACLHVPRVWACGVFLF